MAPDGEEVALDRREQVVEQRHRLGRAHHADGRAELVHVAVGGDAWMVLGDPPAAEEARLAGVTGPRIDLHAGE
jgi:hypothetical protein